MFLGMSLQTFTLIHVLISLLGIGSGFIVICGFLANKRPRGWTAVFLTTTALTSITGFLFPFRGVTPAFTLGIISLVVVAIAIVTRYRLPAWHKTYVISTSAALYFNVFVLVVQSFEKVPALRAIAPTQKELPFVITQLAVLAIFVVLATFAVRRSREELRTFASPRLS